MDIKAKNITVTYGTKKAVDDFTFTFESGKVYALIGPNGCGKSTLVKKLVSSTNPGEVGYVAQETIGLINLTVSEYISLGRYKPGKFFGGLNAEDKKHITDAMETMEVTGLQDRIFDTLSGGEKQRVMAARVIAQDPEWIILDEPSANLDVKHTTHIMNTVKQLQSKGKSFIIVIHDINDAVHYADELVMMREGKLVKSTSTPSAEDFKSLYDAEFMKVTAPDGRDFFYSE